MPFGVGINGVLFEPGTAEFWMGDRHADWNYEALGGAVGLGLDSNHAHVQPGGIYHYHGLPIGLLEELNFPAGKETTTGTPANWLGSRWISCVLRLWLQTSRRPKKWYRKTHDEFPIKKVSDQAEVRGPVVDMTEPLSKIMNFP